VDLSAMIWTFLEKTAPDAEAAAGVPAAHVGTATGDRLVARAAFDVDLADATHAWRAAIPNALAPTSAPS